MEIIFNFKVTESELEQFDTDYSGFTIDEYLADLKSRAGNNNSSIEFEAVTDLQELAGIRGNDKDFDKYTGVLKSKFEVIYNRMFSE